MSGINLEKCDHSKAMALLYHNLRLGRNHSNPDIDPARSRLNTKFVYQGENSVERYQERVEMVKKGKAKGRRLRKDTVTLVCLVYNLPEDFPHPENPKEVDAFFKRCLAIQAKMSGGWVNFVGGQVHRDEVHSYTVSRAVLASEGVSVKPGEPATKRVSRVHMHAQFVPAVDPETIERINGKSPRRKSKKGRTPTGVWFDCNNLVTRAWLRSINAQVQHMALKEFGCHYESQRGAYSNSAEVEQLKLESEIAQQAEPLVEQARKKRAESEALLQQAQKQSESLEVRERDLKQREASFLERVRVWECETKARFIARLEAWLTQKIAEARKVFGLARTEGYETGHAEGYKDGVERGIKARDAVPSPPPANSISDVQLRAIQSLKRQAAVDPGLIPHKPRGPRYTEAEWEKLTPAVKQTLLAQGATVMRRKERTYGRSL